MTASITSIGSKKIVAPKVDQLLLEHGQALAAEHLSHGFVHDFIAGRCDIEILIPESLPRFSSNGGSTVMAEFFSGVLERFLELVRDQGFSELKVQSNRSKMMDVSLDRKEESPVSIVSELFSGSVVYQDFERFIKPKIKVGILHVDNSVTYADIYGEDQSDEFDFNDKTAVKLVVYSDKYLKALNMMFFTNLNYEEHREKFTPKPDPMS